MQSVDSGHAAAIAAGARVPVASVFADWAGTGVLSQAFGDMDEDATSVEVDRSYATGLPEGVGTIEGHAAAELRVEVVGATADAVNRFNTASPLYALPRLNADITASLGMSGYTPVLQFTGRVRTISSDSRSGTARLEALDLAEKFRFAVTIPEFDAFVRATSSQSSVDSEYKIWLNASWIIAEVLAQGGVHVSPAPLAACQLYASLLGSLWARRGGVSDMPVGPYGSAPPFIQGRTGLALNNASTALDANGVGGISWFFRGLNYGSAGRVQVEFWALTPYTGGSSGAYIVEVSNGDFSPTAYVRVTIATDGQMSVVVQRHGQAASTAVLGPTPTGAAAWRYYAVHVAYSSTTATVTIRTEAAETSAAVTVGTAVAAAGGNVDMDLARLGNNVWPAIGSLQISNNTTADFSHSTFVPAPTLEASMLWLDRTPAAADIPGTAWEILTDIAAAESATIELTEGGTVLYRTADRWAAKTTAVAAITATADLLDLAAVEDVDTVRNAVVVPIYDVGRSRSGDFIQMNLGGPAVSTLVPAGETQKIPFNVGSGSHTNTLFTTRLSQGWVVIYADWQQEGHPYYSTTANGAGLAHTGQWSLDRTGLDVGDGIGQVVNVTLTNTTAGGLYIGTGSRMLVVLIPPPRYSATDAASATSYGTRAYTLPDSKWRQQGDGAQAIAARLLADLRNPVALLTDVPVVGDPRRQLGDRITVQDPAGLQVDQDYWVIGIRSSFQPGSLTQSLTLRPCNTFRILKAHAVSWNVVGTASGAFTASWSVAQRVTKAQAATWNVIGTASKVHAVTWDVKFGSTTSVSTSLAVSWDVQATALAAPTFQAAGTLADGIAAVSPAWPVHAINDVGLLVVESCGGEPATLTTPAGFVNVLNSPQATGTTINGTRLTVFWCRATSTAMGAPTIADPGDHVASVLVTFRGCVASGDPWNVSGGSVKATASTTTTFPAVTTTVANCLIVLIATRDSDGTFPAWSALTNAALTGLAEHVDTGTAAGNGGGFHVGSGALTAAGSTGTSTATVDNTINAIMTVALKP